MLREACGVDMISGIQFHGELPQNAKRLCEAHSKAVMQAYSVETDLALKAASSAIAERLLFDAKPCSEDELPGGNGVAFSWPLMQKFETDKPWLLAGGLTPDTVALAIEQSGAPGVDVSSGVERAPGVKDARLIKAFIEAAKRAA